MSLFNKKTTIEQIPPETFCCGATPSMITKKFLLKELNR